MNRAPSLVDTLDLLRGQPVSGLSRTHGSMFFLEIGHMIRREGRKKPHGEWHFLFEMCHWRFSRQSEMLIGSDDDQEMIDRVFRDMPFGEIQETAVTGPFHELNLLLSSGIEFGTFTASASSDDWKQWLLFCPDSIVWTAGPGGYLSARGADEQPTF